MTALLYLALLAIAPELELDRGYRTARVQLSGPLSEVVFRVGGEEATRFVGSLAAGEEREFTLPFPMNSSVREATTQVVGSGRASIVEWTEEPLESLGLASRRTRPPMASVESSAPLPSLLLILASLILVLGLRRRPLLGVAVGTALALAAGVLAAKEAGAESAAVRILEGSSGSSSWLSVETARGGLACGVSLPDRIEIFPEGRGSFWTVELGSAGGLSFRVEAPSATLSLVRRLPGMGPRLVRGNNDLGELSETWVRAGAGGFLAHGAWGVGTGLPEALEGNSSPPGWLASGLPQGTPILLGRLADSESLSRSRADDSGGAISRTWVRLPGF